MALSTRRLTEHSCDAGLAEAELDSPRRDLDLRPMLEASTEQTRELLQRLIRNSRLRVRQTEDGDYRLQGTGHLLVCAADGDRTRTCALSG